MTLQAHPEHTAQHRPSGLAWRAVGAGGAAGVAAGVAALGASLAAGLVVTTLGLPGAAALSALLLALIALIWLRDGNRLRPALAALVLGVPLVLALVEKKTGWAVAGSWQVVPLMLSLFGLAGLYRACRESRPLMGFVVVFATFVAWALLSSLLGRTRPLPGLYQFASDLKPLLLVALGFVVSWNANVDAVLRRFTQWLWLPLAALVVFEWSAPGAFFDVFAGSGHARASLDPTGLLPSRATALFSHPSLLATTAAWFCLLSAAYGADASGRARRRDVLIGLAYFGLVVASVQRQELAALVMALALLRMLGARGLTASRLLASSLILIAAAALFWLVYSDNLVQEFRTWGTDPIRGIEHPRAQIMAGAWRVASERFPFGAGLGTYAGAGAAKFDTSLYLELGFGSYWWFGQQDFLLDTYWPNSLAEAGFVGALLLAGAYLLLWWHSCRCARSAKAGDAARTLARAAAALGLYTLVISATSPAFQDPRLFLLPALLVGISWGARAATHAGAVPR